MYGGTSYGNGGGSFYVFAGSGGGSGSVMAYRATLIYTVENAGLYREHWEYRPVINPVNTEWVSQTGLYSPFLTSRVGEQVLPPLNGVLSHIWYFIFPRSYDGLSVNSKGQISSEYILVRGTPPVPGLGALKGIKTVKALSEAGKGLKTIQTGGHTLNNSTLKALNLTKEQGRNAIHGLKEATGLRPNDHFKIMGNGDVVNPSTGKLIGNLLDYVF